MMQRYEVVGAILFGVAVIIVSAVFAVVMTQIVPAHAASAPAGSRPAMKVHFEYYGTDSFVTSKAGNVVSMFRFEHSPTASDIEAARKTLHENNPHCRMQLVSFGGAWPSLYAYCQ